MNERTPLTAETPFDTFRRIAGEFRLIQKEFRLARDEANEEVMQACNHRQEDLILELLETALTNPSGFEFLNPHVIMRPLSDGSMVPTLMKINAPRSIQGKKQLVVEARPDLLEAARAWKVIHPVRTNPQGILPSRPWNSTHRPSGRIRLGHGINRNR